MGKRQRARDRARSTRPATEGATERVGRYGDAATARAGGPLSPPTSDLEELAWLSQERRRLGDREQQLIESLVAAGTPWPLIASSLGVSRQAARQRFLRTHGIA